MTNELIQKSIQKEKIQMSLSETFLHYRLSITLLIITIFSLTNGFQNVPSLKFDLSYNKIGFIFFLLSVTSFYYQQNRLKLISLKTNQNSTINYEKIIELAKRKNWNIELNTKDALVIKTPRSSYGNGKYFINKSKGEKIYVFFKPNKVLLRSIFDYGKGYDFVISSGENNENEKNILREIKPATEIKASCQHQR
jgi:hypothetical protein